MNTEIIEALRKVPAKHLKIIELVNRVTDRKGKINFDLVDKKALNLARAEAEGYVKATQSAVNALGRME